MKFGFRPTLNAAAATFTFAFLTGCASSSAPPPEPPDELNCPVNYVIVCKGGDASKIRREVERDPRFCQCQPRENVN